jgi:riboflavin biosynthesis pyrimidine reductase
MRHRQQRLRLVRASASRKALHHGGHEDTEDTEDAEVRTGLKSDSSSASSVSSVVERLILQASRMHDWNLRFRRFEEGKTLQAITAKITPFITDVDRGADGRIAIGNDWTRRLFDGPFYVAPPRSPDLPATSLVFVQSRNRNTVAKDPSSLGGGDADLHLIYEGLSRIAADAVLAGAATVRGDIVFSTWHPELVALRASLDLPRHPVQIIATVLGITFDGLIVNVPEIPVMLLTVAGAMDAMSKPLAERPWITPVVMPTPADLADAFRELRMRGIATISCIGGRTLARQLLDAALIEDVYLTTSAKDAGEPDTPLSAQASSGNVIQRKHGTGEDAGVMFEMISASGRS